LYRDFKSLLAASILLVVCQFSNPIAFSQTLTYFDRVFPQLVLLVRLKLNR